jgi:hypothetical protein
MTINGHEAQPATVAARLCGIEANLGNFSLASVQLWPKVFSYTFGSHSLATESHHSSCARMIVMYKPRNVHENDRTQ